jgi:hypothetical protein
MMRSLRVAFTGLAALLTAGAEERVARPAVTVIADTHLRDVAVAVYDSVRPVIYYNPGVITRLGPELGAFFMAHEYGHIAYRHTRSAALRADAGARDSLLQEKELEADCYAARMLAERDRPAAEAAIRFFSRMGPRSFDSEHPTGSRRAARILACLPER